MSTLPHMIQEMPGQAVDASRLKAWGEEAAKLASTAGLSLTESVVQTLGHVKLNAEQVRRVVEFANIDAYNQKFAGMDPSGSRVVHIDGGPADPVQVLQTLSAATPKVAAHSDYDLGPAPKLASGGPGMLFVRSKRAAMNDVTKLRSKLSAAHSLAVEDVEAKEYQMVMALEELSHLVKSAGAQGATAAEFYTAWHRIDPEMAKVAVSRLSSLMVLGTKVAGRELEPSHRVVTAFSKFAGFARGYAQAQVARRELEGELTRVDTWVGEQSHA